MIRHLRHADIDKAAWDARLLRCGNRLWYAQSWVLDRASPGWDALVDDDADAMMPLTWKRKWGVRYLYQPLGLQQLGVFAAQPSRELHRRFIDAIPGGFRYIDIALNEEMADAMPADSASVARRTQALLVEDAIDALRARYATNHRRNLTDAAADISPVQLTVGDFERLFRETTGQRYGARSMEGLEGLMAAVKEGIARGQCRIDALGDAGAAHAAACFVEWEGRSILLKSANTAIGQERKAMFRIVDAWIARHAGTGMLLDFAGSETPGVARFNRGFGAVDTTYFRLRANRLPLPIRWIKR